jgi:hypothetical protein
MKTMLETIQNPGQANALDKVLAVLDASSLSLRLAIQQDNITAAREAVANCRLALDAMSGALEKVLI